MASNTKQKREDEQEEDIKQKRAKVDVEDEVEQDEEDDKKDEDEKDEDANEEDEDKDDDEEKEGQESEYDEEDEEGPELINLPEVNSEEIYVALVQTLSCAKAYAKLIDDSPLSTGIKFEGGYHPRKIVADAICKHGKFTSFELETGDWEAWLSRFPRILRANPHLKSVIIAGASQSGCQGYHKLMLTCLDLPELEYLDCSENYEDMGQGDAVARLIKKHKALKTILMQNNDLEEDKEALVVNAIKHAADSKSLVLEHLEGITLNEERWRKILDLPRESRFDDMSNDDILLYLKGK